MSVKEYSRRDYTVVGCVFPVFYPLCLLFRQQTGQKFWMASPKWFLVPPNGTVEKWSGAIQWERRDSRLDNLPMMSTLWPTITVTVFYALGAGMLIRGRFIT